MDDTAVYHDHEHTAVTWDGSTMLQWMSRRTASSAGPRDPELCWQEPRGRTERSHYDRLCGSRIGQGARRGAQILTKEGMKEVSSGTNSDTCRSGRGVLIASAGEATRQCAICSSDVLVALTATFYTTLFSKRPGLPSYCASQLPFCWCCTPDFFANQESHTKHQLLCKSDITTSSCQPYLESHACVQGTSTSNAQAFTLLRRVQPSAPVVSNNCV